MGVEHEHHITHHHESRRTVGKINDELRFSIIDAVYLRPAIWDHGRELRNLGQRKDHFIEIAALLSTDENLLSCKHLQHMQFSLLKEMQFLFNSHKINERDLQIVDNNKKRKSKWLFIKL